MEIPSFKRFGAVRAKLVRRARTKGAIVVACVIVLVLGILLAPPRVPEEPAPPREKVAPILEAEVEKREPTRVFRGIREAGLQALPWVVSFHSSRNDTRRARGLDFSQPNLNEPRPSGCGLLVSSEGAVLTHVAALAGEPVSLCATHDGMLAPAHVVAFEAETGLVLLRTSPRDPGNPNRVATIAPSQDLVIAVARRGSLPHVVPVSLDTDCTTRCALMTIGGEVEPGMPIFDLSGSALAVIGKSSAEVIAYGVGEAVRRLETLVAEKRPFPASLGLAFQAMSSVLAERLGQGALVSDTVHDGPADRAGLRAGDVITSIGSNPVRTFEEAQSLVAAALPGEPLNIEFRRDNRAKTMEAMPVPAPFGVPRSNAIDAPPAGAPRARDVFSPAALSAAGVDGDTTVLSIERFRVRSLASVRRLLARRRAPWLVYFQQGNVRFYALMSEGR